MTRDFASLPEDTPPGPPLHERLRALPIGSKIVSIGGFLLFFSLFLTWQNQTVVYPGTGTAPAMLDGWDFWGLLIGLTTVALVTLVLLLNASDLALAPSVRWDLIVAAGALAVFVLTLVKNLTDAGSTWASYVGVGLAALVVVGAYLEWSHARSFRVRRRRRRRLSSAV